MMTVHDLVAAHGTQRLAGLLQASPTAISNMKRDNRIPAKKYRLAQRAAALAGIGPIPDELFTFDRLRPKPDAPDEGACTDGLAS